MGTARQGERDLKRKKGDYPQPPEPSSEPEERDEGADVVARCLGLQRGWEAEDAAEKQTEARSKRKCRSLVEADGGSTLTWQEEQDRRRVAQEWLVRRGVLPEDAPPPTGDIAAVVHKLIKEQEAKDAAKSDRKRERKGKKKAKEKEARRRENKWRREEKQKRKKTKRKRTSSSDESSSFSDSG